MDNVQNFNSCIDKLSSQNYGIKVSYALVVELQIPPKVSYLPTTSRRHIPQDINLIFLYSKIQDYLIVTVQRR
jgi:hypothetical protein